MKNSSKSKKGFTLIELLVVITIIGILAGVGMISYYDAQKRGRDARRYKDLEEIKKALQLYYQDNGRFPASEWNWSNQGDSWIPGLAPTYINKVPVDPVNNGGAGICWSYESATCFSYAYYSGGWCNMNANGQYILFTRLESKPTDSSKSQVNYLNADGSLCSAWMTTPYQGIYNAGQ